jgi:hypothetical protein
LLHQSQPRTVLLDAGSQLREFRQLDIDAQGMIGRLDDRNPRGAESLIQGGSQLGNFPAQ